MPSTQRFDRAQALQINNSRLTSVIAPFTKSWDSGVISFSGMTLVSDASVQTNPYAASPQKAGLLERLLDTLPDGLLLIREERSIGYANKAFVDLWKVPSDLQIYKNDFALLNYVTSQLVDPYVFISEVERLYCSNETSEDELHFKDGRVLVRRSMPITDDKNGNGRLWIYTAVTDLSISAARASDSRGNSQGITAAAGSVAVDQNRKGLFKFMRDAIIAPSRK
jgi:PAS domain-containing protein